MLILLKLLPADTLLVALLLALLLAARALETVHQGLTSRT